MMATAAVGRARLGRRGRPRLDGDVLSEQILDTEMGSSQFGTIHRPTRRMNDRICSVGLRRPGAAAVSPPWRTAIDDDLGRGDPSSDHSVAGGGARRAGRPPQRGAEGERAVTPPPGDTERVGAVASGGPIGRTVDQDGAIRIGDLRGPLGRSRLTCRARSKRRLAADDRTLEARDLEFLLKSIQMVFAGAHEAMVVSCDRAPSWSGPANL